MTETKPNYILLLLIKFNIYVSVYFNSIFYLYLFIDILIIFQKILKMFVVFHLLYFSYFVFFLNNVYAKVF